MRTVREGWACAGRLGFARWRRALGWTAAGLSSLTLAALLVLLLFPWDRLRPLVNDYVSDKTGRRFEIAQRLDLQWHWRGPTIRMEGVRFANPTWARRSELLQARTVEFDVRVWPLLTARRLEIPRLALSEPELGLQMESDGRRTWALGSDTADTGTVPVIGSVQIDRGGLDFLATHLGVDLQARFDLDRARGPLPLQFELKGRYRQQPLQARGQAGDILQLHPQGGPPLALEIDARAGATRLKATGAVAALAELQGVDARFDLRGQTLGDLFPLLGVALPQTPPYALAGRLQRQGDSWKVDGLQGRLGLSDIGGQLAFDVGGRVPRLSGALRSAVMDMDDLGPLVGLPPTARSARALEGVEPPPTLAPARRRTGNTDRVLPTAALDLERLRAMNADVHYVAERIRNVHQLPLDRGSVQVRLQDGVLTLDPLDLGVADGRVAGAIRIDASQVPADIRTVLDARGLQLNRLIPRVETLRTSFGRLDGRVQLAGRGNSVAQWLGGASGDVAALTGRGRFSNLLLEFMGLDGGEILAFLLRGDRDVQLRCAALAFDVERGRMQARSLVFDTEDTVFHATGQASLADETMDFRIRPEPKDMSVLSVRTPLRVQGSFGAPRAGLEASGLLARGAAALALATVNPLLALAATVETGPGQDEDCRRVLAQARQPVRPAAAAGAARAREVKPRKSE